MSESESEPFASAKTFGFTSGGMRCTNCNAVFPVQPRALISTLIAGVTVTCPNCGEPYDVWKQLVGQLRFGVFGFRYAAIGANVVVTEIELRRNQQLVLDLATLGVPETAWIEEVHLTPQGGRDGFLQPVFLRDPQPPHPASAPLVIYPVPIGAGTDVNSASLLVVWTAQSDHGSPSGAALIAGVRAAQRGDHLGTIVSSNAAMELALGATASRWLERHGVGRDRRKQFLDGEATYGAQLLVLLPVMASTACLPHLPDQPAAALSRLRRLRNEVAHAGVRSEAISDDDIALSLAGAAVGVVYCETMTATFTASG